MELLWYALSRTTPRPVFGQDIPMWFAALLLFGLLCAGALFSSALAGWCVGLYRK
jgi:hypothetical protein